MKSDTKILESSGDQLSDGVESSGLLAAVVAPQQPLVPCEPLLDAPDEDMDDDVFDDAGMWTFKALITFFYQIDYSLTLLITSQVKILLFLSPVALRSCSFLKY